MVAQVVAFGALRTCAGPSVENTDTHLYGKTVEHYITQHHALIYITPSKLTSNGVVDNLSFSGPGASPPEVAPRTALIMLRHSPLRMRQALLAIAFVGRCHSVQLPIISGAIQAPLQKWKEAQRPPRSVRRPRRGSLPGFRTPARGRMRSLPFAS